jgi:hypothetical protein
MIRIVVVNFVEGMAPEGPDWANSAEVFGGVWYT